MSFERLAPEHHDTLEGIPDPAENPNLAGHGGAVAHLTQAHAAGRLPHGLILAGPSGIGKATLAFHFARHLLQGAGQAFATIDPKSPLFRQVAAGAHPSVLHLTRPANDKGNGFKTVIPVDEVRRIGRFLSHTAHDGGFRVVIVDPADDLNTQAANALLKNLEEPPARTVFVLITHSRGSLLPTLRSRCQVLKLSPLDEPDLFRALDGLVSSLPSEVAARSALHRRAGGSVRQAILIAEHGGIDIARAVEKLAASPRFDVADAHRLADAVSARGREAALEIFRNEALDMLTRAAADAARAGNVGAAARLAQAWQEARAREAEASAFNLDRKQQALDLIGRLHAAMNG